MAWPLAGFRSLSSGPSDLDLTILLGSLQVSTRDMQDISPLTDASAELAIKPTGPLPRPSVWNRKWTAAIVVSCLLHAAVAVAFLISPSGISSFQDAIQSEGSDQSGANVVGSAQDKDPPAINVALVPNPQPTKPEPAKPAPPTEPAQPARQAAKPPLKPLPEPVKQQMITPDILVAGAPRPDDQSVSPKAETPAQPTVQAESIEMPVAVPEQAPIPSARPIPAVVPATASEPYEKRGTADGHEIKAAIASKGKKQTDAGNAATSLYSGEVANKLARANRRVSKAAQSTARNNAMVAFVVLANGNISDLQLAKSSGSPELDQFALELVRKQAPFPPFPPETGKLSWRFKAPIGPF
ncbi:TonB family protein [Mesorhizobium sp. M1050]|uniref:energy transducer TonB family protein n=1 Tax=Mesorhizobium sp. M1050 TaxID=2957051 RepID=UPI00333911E8